MTSSMFAMINRGHIPWTFALTLTSATPIILAGIALVVIGALLILIVRWRRVRADRAYFESMSDVSFDPSPSPQGMPFAVALDEAPGIANNPPLDRVQMAPHQRIAATSGPTQEAVTPLSQEANDAMAELDRLLGNKPE